MELTHDLLVPLVARARERREAEEKAEAERVEAERLAAAEREHLAAAEWVAKQAKAAQRRARLVSVAMAVLFLLALIGGWQALEHTQKAQEGLKQAAERAQGRAREQLVLGERENYVAYLAESIDFDFTVAANEAELAVQQRTSPRLKSVLEHKAWVSSATFSPDGTRVVTASFDNTARLWDAQSGQAIGAPLQHEKDVHSAAFSPDGTRVVTASFDNTARIWDAQSGQAIGAPLKHEEAVTSAAFSPDGTRVVTASMDGTARIWDAQSGQAIGAPLMHKRWVNSAAFSPDGTRVVTASFDNTARIWDAQSGQAIGAPLKHEEAVTSAAFSPDGTRVVTASMDGTARIWDAQSADMLGAPVTADDLIALSGRRVADNGQLEWLPGPELIALISKVRAKADQGTTKKDQLVRWHFADPATRTISPFSQITVPKHIEREIAWVLERPQTEETDGPNYSPKILNDAYNLDPGHPLILLALSVFETRAETKALWKRLSFPRFENDARLAARAAEILLIDKDPENASTAAHIALALPTARAEDRAKAQAVLNQIAKAAN
ncbi:WD40 repeat domain-containing protein [Aquimonas sp.]|uniref:WD40 repeat domain-containing protein n=1 Tax=Aquimonas sp. TaxID=1872588 RepID=UPI0037BF035C